MRGEVSMVTVELMESKAWKREIVQWFCQYVSNDWLWIRAASSKAARMRRLNIAFENWKDSAECNG